MSLQSERIQLLMQRLGLTEMVHGYAAVAEQAAQKNLPYCDVLEQILESEANVRQERNIKVRTHWRAFRI
jgi:DNA replication protein DnaC